MNFELIKKSILFFLVVCFISKSEAQCTIEILSVDEILQRSESSFFGLITEKETIFNQSDNRIYTIYKVVSEEDIKSIAVPGGTWNNLTEIVSPNAEISIGNTALFLMDQMINIDTFDFLVPLIGPYNVLIYDLPTNLFLGPFGSYTKSKIVDLLPSLKGKIKEVKDIKSKVRSIPPKIDSIVPNITTAGTESIVTIHGKHFGSNPDGTSLVEFRNPDIGTLIIGYQGVLGNHIISWSDEAIKLIVPGRDPSLNRAGAGSGQIRVTNDIGQVGNGPSIKVLYNRFLKSADDQMLYQNDNTLGGYTLRLNQQFEENSAAKEDFLSALEKWQCGVQSNLAVGPITTVNSKSNDGINLVSFDINNSLPSGVLAQTTHWFITCSDGTPIFLEMDMIINESISWHYGDS